MAEEVHLSGVAERYALALFELAQKDNLVDIIATDLAALKAAVAHSADLTRFVRAPVFSREEQKKGMAALLKAMGACALTEKFVLLMAAKGRLYLLLDAVAAYEALLAKSHGEIKAQVTAARPLSDAELAELKAVLKEKLGREPRLDTDIDPSLLGGLIVKVGSKMIDSSLRAKLSGLRAAMRG